MFGNILNAVRQLSPIASLVPLFFSANVERLRAVREKIAAIDGELAELERQERAAAYGLISAAGLPLKDAPNDDGLFALLGGEATS